MMNLNPLFGSSGAQNLLAMLRSHAGTTGRGAFPRSWSQSMSRNSGTTPAAWFAGCVDALGVDPENCAIDTNIACFGVVDWQNTTELTYVCLHVLVATESAVEDVYCDWSLPSHYFRLEIDPTKPGPLFKEPSPHVHVHLDGEPRFAFGTAARPYVLQDFLEFIYRNYQYERWAAWARTVFKEREAKDIEELELFDGLVQAFKRGQFALLSGKDMNEASRRVRSALDREVREACDLVWPNESRAVLCYP